MGDRSGIGAVEPASGTGRLRYLAAVPAAVILQLLGLAYALAVMPMLEVLPFGLMATVALTARRRHDDAGALLAVATALLGAVVLGELFFLSLAFAGITPPFPAWVRTEALLMSALTLVLAAQVAFAAGCVAAYRHSGTFVPAGTGDPDAPTA